MEQKSVVKELEAAYKKIEELEKRIFNQSKEYRDSQKIIELLKISGLVDNEQVRSAMDFIIATRNN